MFGFPILSTP
jgi:hypothetical protein